MATANSFAVYPIRPTPDARRRAAMARVFHLLLELAGEPIIPDQASQEQEKSGGALAGNNPEEASLRQPASLLYPKPGR